MDERLKKRAKAEGEMWGVALIFIAVIAVAKAICG